MSLGLLFCTFVSDFRNQGQFQPLEKFQVLQTLIFFLGLHPLKKLGLYHKSEKKTQVATQKKIQVLKTRIFFPRGMCYSHFGNGVRNSRRNGIKLL